jgi:SAM-dependent methyltransferase
MQGNSDNSRRQIENARRRLKTRIIGAYDSIIIRAYCYVRFLIMNMRIMEEIEQYLPRNAVILDVGCGFGLFSLFFAGCSDTRRLVGFDVSPKRIAIAKKTRDKLGFTKQIAFHDGDVADYSFEQPVDAIVMLDLYHHLEPEIGERILASFHSVLNEDGVLVIKDVASRPWGKMAFTWVLDKLVNARAVLRYYTKDEMITLLKDHGFDVKFHHMPDILPYPHILYVCRKAKQEL